MTGLGVSGEFSFCDVFGFDPDLLAMVPQPVIATMLLFPCTPNQDAAKCELMTVCVCVLPFAPLERCPA